MHTYRVRYLYPGLRDIFSRAARKLLGSWITLQLKKMSTFETPHFAATNKRRATKGQAQDTDGHDAQKKSSSLSLSELVVTTFTPNRKIDLQRIGLFTSIGRGGGERLNPKEWGAPGSGILESSGISRNVAQRGRGPWPGLRGVHPPSTHPSSSLSLHPHFASPLPPSPSLSLRLTHNPFKRAYQFSEPARTTTASNSTQQ